MSQKSGSLFDMQFITSCISTMLVLLLLGMVCMASSGEHPLATTT